ncbi:MAG: Smr/MutS family protein [Alphaproteobacteria bacterium]|nr:Smr/MutS family protein [Alphaproteobacteria bacterium]MCB9927939.1 Smr/MutS family protein [Alphaproteobacteria bacterium]
MAPRRLSLEERDLWQRVAQSVTPLRRRTLVPSVGPERHERHTAPAPEPTPTVAAAKPRTAEAPASARQISTKIPVMGLDKRTAQRLRKGKMPIEGRLDLHGMTQKEAHQALNRFVAASRTMNRRLVLVITGKGWDPMASRREDAVGVLRRSVPRWLETPPLNQHVAAITDAHAKDGGSGALYVLLRRHRRAAPLT